MDFLILTGATWYLAYALTSTEGAFKMFSRLRAVTTFGGMLDCIVCTSFWIGIIAALLLNYPLIWGIGAAGFACLLHSYTGWRNANY